MKYPKPKPRKKSGKLKWGENFRTPEQLEYARLLKECDKLWKELVLRRDKNYDHYRQKPANQAHHIISRAYFPTRWLLINGVALAAGTHGFDAHGKGSADFSEWIRQKWVGEENYLALLRRKNNRMKRCTETLKVVRQSLITQKEFMDEDNRV